MMRKSQSLVILKYLRVIIYQTCSQCFLLCLSYCQSQLLGQSSLLGRSSLTDSLLGRDSSPIGRSSFLNSLLGRDSGNTLLNPLHTGLDVITGCLKKQFPLCFLPICQLPLGLGIRFYIFLKSPFNGLFKNIKTFKSRICQEIYNFVQANKNLF